MRKRRYRERGQETCLSHTWQAPLSWSFAQATTALQHVTPTPALSRESTNVTLSMVGGPHSSTSEPVSCSGNTALKELGLAQSSPGSKWCRCFLSHQLLLNERSSENLPQGSSLPITQKNTFQTVFTSDVNYLWAVGTFEEWKKMFVLSCCVQNSHKENTLL